MRIVRPAFIKKDINTMTEAVNPMISVESIVSIQFVKNSICEKYSINFGFLQYPCYNLGMVIKRLSVKGFRNHADTEIKLSPKINVLVGKNAQGKTNLLEAIYLTCVGRGWRTHKEREMIGFDFDDAKVRTVVKKSFGDIVIEIKLSRAQKKSIKINDIPVAKMGELMGQVNCVFFSPDELRLIKDAPADRRRFMDIDISQVDKSYFYALLRYNKVLMQRNALLKSKDEDIGRGLDIWDVQLVSTGSYIIEKRRKYLEMLEPSVKKVHSYMTRKKEDISLEYVAYELERELKMAREKDMRLKTTTVGPHRDDLLIQINGKDVRSFASQGQQRTAALSLKLGELELFENITGEKPVLLLDDVFSELDDDRQERLIKLLSYCQSVITTTQPIKNCDTCHNFVVENGKILVSPNGVGNDS